MTYATIMLNKEHIHSPGLPSSKSSDVSPCPKVTAETRKVKRGNTARVQGSHGEWDKQLKGEVGSGSNQ